MDEKEILLVGEPMGLFISKEVGAFEDVDEFYLRTCGAELNVAIGIKRLGHTPAYMTKLGDDIFGKKILKQMKTIGISTADIINSKEYSTGFMFKSKVNEGDPAIAYFRKGSAASTLCGADIKTLDFSKYDIIHCTGITPALTDNTKEATETLLKLAIENNIMFSFDPNLRPQLWDSQEQMANYINKIASQSDLFMPGVNEAKLLINESEPEKIAKKYLELGAKTVIVKVGSKGAYYANAKESGFVKGYKVDKVIDTVGAGDGFAAGVLTALKEGKSIEEAVQRGNGVGAIQVMSMGDNEGLPTTEELTKFMSGEKNWR